MVKRVLRWWVSVGFLFACVVSVSAVTVRAETLQSSNYKFDESTLGSGGLVQSSSTNYQGSSSLGDLGTGEAASSNFQVQNGSQTTPDPALSFAINGSGANFGSFSASGATTATTTFSISNYTSYGYVVQIAGSPPSNGGHTIAAMATSGASTPGFEQFGINLVANTAPASFGVNPDHGQFGFGSASTNYATANQYRYVSGETIASAPKSSGVTTYTISYLVNVASLTPGGQYTSNQTIVITGTY